MSRQQTFLNLANYILSAIGMLELENDSQLRQDVMAICDYVKNPRFRIAVFAPFNYGKSTLLNSLLGEKTLPIDLIPTTGAAIYVRYGEKLSTRIALQDGSKIEREGTDILKEYAILDDQRCMRDDVTAVEVYCPHPFLQTGVEFLDLPGTNDREAQDDLVKNKLLTADLIVQVLDARKLMTLGEREHLRDWLLDRGIKTVVFVVNFLNLLEPEEQKEVYNRLRFVAETFRSELPTGISNLYRVDALPALRSRLKGDTSAAHASGLIVFESALQTIVEAHKEQLEIRLPRLLTIVDRVYRAAADKKQKIVSELEADREKDRTKNEIKQKAKKLIEQGIQRSNSDFQSWLYLPNLLKRYQPELAIALQQNELNSWQEREFKPIVLDYQKQINEWVAKACEFFDRESSEELLISFPQPPEIANNHSESSSNNPDGNNRSKEDVDVASVAIPTGIGWLLGGPVGAAILGGASYILNKAATQSSESPIPKQTTTKINSQVYADAAEAYLTIFSNEAFSQLNQYEKIVEKVIDFQPQKTSLENTLANHKLQLLNNLLENLKQELNSLDRNLS
jgi:SLT domain-containing protein